MKRGSASSTTVQTAPVGRSGIVIVPPSLMIWLANTSGEVAKLPEHETSTVNSSAATSSPAGAPSTVLVMLRSAVLRVFVNEMVGSASELMITTTSFGEVSVQPVGGVCSVTVQAVPSGSSGTSPVLVVTPTPSTTVRVKVCVAPFVQLMSTRNVPLRSTG